MTDETPFTKLEAVNYLFNGIVQTPLSALTETPATPGDDEALALACLTEWNRKCQLECPWFCSIHKKVLREPVADEIVLDDDIGRIVRNECFPGRPDVVELYHPGDEKWKVWNVDDNTFTMTGSIYLDEWHIRDFETLPKQMKAYIVAQARVRFIKDSGSSETLLNVASRDVNVTKNEVIRDQLARRRATHFRRYSGRRHIQRRYPYLPGPYGG